MTKGLLITFEGGEGAGKTTLIDSIFHHLQDLGKQVIKTREPGGTTLGEKIRELLLYYKGPVSPYAELSLFLASRAQHIAELILPSLKEGKIVLCDRFNDSTIAYQGEARGLGMNEVAHVCQFISEGVTPHLTLYLDISPEIGLARVKKNRTTDRIETENLAFHAKIRNGFLAIHQKEPKRFRLIDATASPAFVFEQAMKWITPLLLTRYTNK